MAGDWFDELAAAKVPPVPDHFDREVRRRVNNALLAVQVIELATKGFLYACGHFSRALVDLLIYTFSGKFGTDRRDRP
jgi:hypothetical protein